MFSKISRLSIFAAVLITASVSTGFAANGALASVSQIKANIEPGEYTVAKEGASFFKSLFRGELINTAEPTCLSQTVLQNPDHLSMLSIGAKVTGVAVAYVDMGGGHHGVQMQVFYDVVNAQTSMVEELNVGCMLK